MVLFASVHTNTFINHQKKEKRKKNANYKFDQALICSLSILVLTLKIDTHLSKFEASFQENF